MVSPDPHRRSTLSEIAGDLGISEQGFHAGRFVKALIVDEGQLSG